MFMIKIPWCARYVLKLRPECIIPQSFAKTDFQKGFSCEILIITKLVITEGSEIIRGFGEKSLKAHTSKFIGSYL